MLQRSKNERSSQAVPGAVHRHAAERALPEATYWSLRPTTIGAECFGGRTLNEMLLPRTERTSIDSLPKNESRSLPSSPSLRVFTGANRASYSAAVLLTGSVRDRLCLLVESVLLAFLPMGLMIGLESGVVFESMRRVSFVSVSRRRT